MIRRRFHRIAWGCGLITIGIGGLTLIGWKCHLTVLTSLSPDLVSMKVNTAVAFLCAGISLLLQIRPGTPPARAYTGRGCAALVTAIGLATLVQYVADTDLGIDQLLARAPLMDPHTSIPGRMAALTALSHVLVGTSLALLDSRREVLRSASQVMATTVMLLGFVAVTCYLLGASAVYAIPGLTSMAFHAALGFAVVATGVLLSRPQRGMVQVVAKDDASGIALRKVLVESIAALTIIGWLRVAGQRAGFYGAQLGAALAVAAGTSSVVLLALWNVIIQRRTDEARHSVARDEHILFELGDRMRTSTYPDEMLSHVTARLGEYLGVSRCLFIEIDASGSPTTVRDNYPGDLPSLEGLQPLSLCVPECVAGSHAGETVVNSNTQIDERTAHRYQGVFRPAAICSYVAVPLSRRGRWVSTLLASTHEPRPWQRREIALLQTAAEHTWLWFEHLMALQAVQEREHHMAAVLDVAFDAIISMDPSGVMVEFNRAAERTFGYGRDAVVGKSMAELLVLQAGREAFRIAFEHGRDSGAASSPGRATPFPALRADGSEIAIEVAIAAVGDGDALRVTAFVRDVTEQRRAMEQLLLAIEAAPNGMILVDREGNIALVNAQLEKLFGYRRDQLVGKPVELLVPDRFRIRHPALRTAFLDDPRFHTMGAGRELFGQHRDGRAIPIEIALNPFHIENKEFVLSSVIDITERKRVIQVLQENEERLQLAQQIARIGSFEWDVNADSVTWTAQLEAMYGLPTGGFPRTRKTWEDMVHPEDRAGVHISMDRALEAGEVAESEWRIVHPDGKVRWLAGRWKVFKDEAGNPLRATGVNIDVTERKQTEQEREDLLGQLARLNAELEQRVRDRTSELTAALKERDVLLEEVHHRVKNNLQIISSLINLQSKKLDGADNRSGLEECRRRVETIALIHEQLYQAKDYARVPFSDYVRRLVGNVFHATGACHPNVALDVDVDNISLPVDKAIPCALILNELLTNAFKHAFPGTRQGAIQIELHQGNTGEATLTVRDDGTGIPDDAGPTSMSLGMRLVTMLVRQIHGTLEITRHPGVAFQITFPVTGSRMS